MSTISAGNTLTTGFVASSDTTGNLVFQTNGTTTALTLTTGQNANVVGSVSSVNTFGFKNRIINGDMRIDQRAAGASFTPTTSINYGSCDRWSFDVSQNSKMTAQQNAGAVTPPAGFINYQGVTSSSSYTVLTGDYFIMRQAIEGLNIADLGWGTANAKTITLSFWVRSSLTGTFSGSLRNSASNRSYPFTYTITAANTWEFETITIAGDTAGTWLTTNGIGINLDFSLGAGSTYSGTANAWAGANYVSATGATSVVGTNGATFYITGVQLEVGTQATNFDFRDYGRELILCQRYYETSGVLSGLIVGMYSVASGYGAYYYKVTKRTTPTVTTASVGTFTVYNNSATYGVSSFGNTPQINMCSVGVNLSSSVGSGGSASIVSSSDANSLMFSAEL